MKLDFNIIETGIHIENCQDFRISRHIFRWNETNIFLVRAYYYSDINIVIISHIKGEFIKSKDQITTIIGQLQLKLQKTILITHIKNKFYKPIVRSNPINCIIQKDNYWQLDDENEIGFNKVKELIGSEIEPVEKWLSLDVDLYHEIELKRQEELQELLQIYLKPDLEFFTSKFEQIEYEKEQIFEPIKDEIIRENKFDLPIKGALFYYPETKLEDQQKACIFMEKQYIKVDTDYYISSALPYVNKYDVETEVVICVNIGNDRSVCGIFPKINFLRSKKVLSDC